MWTGGYVDMWTGEVAKLKEKDQSMKTREAAKVGGVSEYVENLRTTMKLPAFLWCSEASLSMILGSSCA